jgi:hypothetical protein
MIADTLFKIGQQLDIFHEASVTTTTFRVVIDNGTPVYHLTAPQLNGMGAEFRDGESVISFLESMNAKIQPEISQAAYKELESLKQEQIKRDAKITALEKEISDLPQTQVLIDAQAAAAKILVQSEEKLVNLEAAKVALEKEAAAKAVLAEEALSKATPEELAKLAEIEAAKENQ